MALRRDISTKARDRDEGDGPVYQASRGGWYPEPPKPVPGAGAPAAGKGQAR